MSDPGHIMEITKLIMQREPGLLACEPKAIARASGSLAEVLGCVLANVLVMKGEATYRECVKVMLGKIDDAARSTAAKAREEANDPSSGTLQ